jgi:hypothetical protein
MGYRDVMEMDVRDMLWFLTKLNETREHEAEVLAKASKGG